MAPARFRGVFYALMVFCLLRAEARVGLQPSYDDTEDRIPDDGSHDMIDMEILENDARQVDETHDAPADVNPPLSDLEIEHKTDDSFQGCMVECINADLCCSCKDSGKKSMVAAMVNQLAADCAPADVTDCAGKWVRKNLVPNERGQASNCTRPDIVSSNVQHCVSQCVGRPLSKPLNPKYPSFYPGRPREINDLSDVPKVNLSDFCEDMRAEGFFCVSWRSDSFTAGNTMCRANNRCGHHGYSYSWCYVSWSNHWDYCCTGSCGFGQGTSYEWCQSGNKWQYCGKGANVDVKDRHCADEYPCGMHQEIGKASYYWCYLDHRKNWDRCCQPWHPCGKHDEGYNWCYTGYKKKSQWRHCVP